MSYYEILGVQREAKEQEIKDAYKRKALTTHPDKNPGSDAKSNFQKLLAAYETLIDPKKRKDYDSTLPRQPVGWRGWSSAGQHQQGYQTPSWSTPPASDPYGDEYWRQGTARRTSDWANGSQWESRFKGSAQDWYQKWDQEQTAKKKREQEEREADKVRAIKAENERRHMDWLLKQQLILKEVVHLAIQIGLAEPAKGGFPNEGTDSSTNDGDVDDLEGHIIYSENIKLNNLKRELQKIISNYHQICKEQRKVGHLKEALDAERDLERVRDKSRARNSAENLNAREASTTRKEQPGRERTPDWLEKEANVTEAPSPVTTPSSELKALHMSHANVHQGFWEIVEEGEQSCYMCEAYGTLLQCPECEIQACEKCKSALCTPGGTFGPRARPDWN